MLLLKFEKLNLFVVKLQSILLKVAVQLLKKNIPRNQELVCGLNKHVAKFFLIILEHSRTIYDCMTPDDF